MLVNLYLSDRSRKRNYASVLALSCNFPQEKAWLFPNFRKIELTVSYKLLLMKNDRCICTKAHSSNNHISLHAISTKGGDSKKIK